jgi:acetyl esterase/lipase
MPLIHRLLAAGALLFLTACASVGFSLFNIPSSLQGGYSFREAAYGAGPSEKMDIYVPLEDSSAKHEVIVFFYGGRWQSGKKEDYRFVGAALARRGFVTVIPDFPKYPDVRFPTFVQAAARSVAWVDDHVDDYGGRQDRIHIAGHSSGAHMAALLIVDTQYLAAEGKDAREVIKGFAGLAGPYAFTPDEPDLMDIFGPPDRYPQMQVTTFVEGREPPMLLLYGQEDRSVKPSNHERLAQRIRDKGGRVEVLTYPELGHIGIVGTFSELGPTSSVVEDMSKFFRANNR